MFRRMSSIVSSDGADDLAPTDDYASRQRRWNSTIDKIDANFTESLRHDATHLVNKGSLVWAGGAPQTLVGDDYFHVMAAPGTAYEFHPMSRLSRVASSQIRKKTLSQWIQENGMGGGMVESKKYFERAAGLLNSLVLKIIITNVKGGKAEMDVAVDPKLITSENLMVHHSLNEGESIHFIRSETEDISNLDDCAKKYSAMKALGGVAYELLMRGAGPPIKAFLPSTVTNSEGTPRLLLCLDDYDEKTEKIEDPERDQAKRPRSSDGGNLGRISAAMIQVGVPYPLCRFVVDLLGGECSDGLLFRSDNSFESFSDILADLKQMMEKPEAFIHLSVRDQWRLAFGEKMHGREKEKQMLIDVAARISGTRTNDALFEALALVLPQNKQQIAMVTGQAGVGKSRLVMETRKNLENQGWFFLSCKFDRIVHSEPLSIIAGAFDEFLEKCSGTPRRHQIGSQIKKSMQPGDISLLVKHVPSLVRYIDGPLEPTYDFEVNKEQAHRLFSQLIRALASGVQNVAFFVDDLQWADSASIDLFLALIEPSEPELSCKSSSSYNIKKSKVLFIGSYRDHEAKDNPMLIQMLNQLQKTESVQLTNISVSGFDSDTLNGIVSESLCLPMRRTKPLTEIILQKTDGLVIHIIEFIGRLTMDKILRHCFVRGWNWDSEVIEGCPISENVAELFSLKLKSLSADELEGLKICSMFGIRIDERIIDFLDGYSGDASVDIKAGLNVATELGLVETYNSSQGYKFSHDIIAQATIELIPEDERSQLLQKLVSALVKNATAANEIDAVIFVAVDLINRMKIEEVTCTKARVLYATMNDKAGKMALTVPDFSSALRYSESAISFLNDCHWESHHDLMISINQTSAVALYSGTHSNNELFKKRVDAVLEHAANVDEEFKTRYVMIRRLGQNQVQEAIQECHSFLERLGEPIKSSDASLSYAKSELLRVKEALMVKKHQLSSQMVDPTKIKVMKIMSCLMSYYHIQRNYLCVVLSSKMVEMSMHYGCSEDSIFGLATFASHIVAIIGDIDNGCSWARTALKLISNSRYNINAILPEVHLAVYAFALLWREPLQATVEPILQGCCLAFAQGNIMSAMNCAKLFIPRYFYCGKNINALLRSIEKKKKKSALHGQISFIEQYLVPLNNVLRELKGLKNQVLPPLDAFINNNDLANRMMKEADPVDVENLLMLEITSAFLCVRDMEKAQRLAGLIKSMIKMKPLVFNYMMIDFYVGLTACFSSRQPGDINQTIEARKICRNFKWLISHSKWSFENKYHLIDAECCYAEGEFSKAALAYNASILSARNHKFIHEEALACELAGYFYKDQGDVAQAAAMFKQARESYIKWGAVGKAKSLPQL